MSPERARELLQRERERVQRALAELQPAPAGGEPADPDDQPADLGTETFERELDDSLAIRLRDELEAIERAEERLADGTYGLSVESGEPIPDGRLELIPWAERTAEEQSRYERSG